MIPHLGASVIVVLVSQTGFSMSDELNNLNFEPLRTVNGRAGKDGSGRGSKNIRVGTGDDDDALFHQILNALRKLEKLNNRLPNLSELSEETGADSYKIFELLWKRLPEIATALSPVFAANLKQMLLTEMRDSSYSKRVDYELILRSSWFYCIAFISTLEVETAEELTILAMKESMSSGVLNGITVAGLPQPGAAWDSNSKYIVDAVFKWHQENSPAKSELGTDASKENSSTMDWENSMILGTQRVKRCISRLPEEQKRVFVLRHQLSLGLSQVATLLNENEHNVTAWLHQARVLMAKYLGNG